MLSLADDTNVPGQMAKASIYNVYAAFIGGLTAALGEAIGSFG